MLKEFRQGFEIERKAKERATHERLVTRRLEQMKGAREESEGLLYGSHPVRDFIDRMIDKVSDWVIKSVTGDAPHKDEPKSPTKKPSKKGGW